MEQLFCETCGKLTIHFSVKGKNALACFQCKNERPRPQPDMKGWNEREKEAWRVIFALECKESPMSVKRILDNMPYANAYTEWDVRKVLEMTGKLGTEASNEEMSLQRRQNYSVADATLLNNWEAEVHTIIKKMSDIGVKKFSVSHEQRKLRYAILRLIGEAQYHKLIEQDIRIVNGTVVDVKGEEHEQ